MSAFIKSMSDMVQLFSGDDGDMIPFVAFGQRGEKVYAKIPGGNGLELKPEVLISLGIALIQLGTAGFIEDREILWGIISDQKQKLEDK